MTKSYNYIPTHFLYSPLLFFLLIFMHQLTYCHTLPKPFSQIFLFRIYAPTIHSTDIDSDETSDRLPHISTPNQPPQTNPPTTQSHRYTHQYNPQTLDAKPAPPTLSTLTQHRRCRSLCPSAIGQARHQAGHNLTGQVQDQTKPDQARPCHRNLTGQADSP